MDQCRGPFRLEWFLITIRLHPRILARSMPPRCPSPIGSPALGIWETSPPRKLLTPYDCMVAVEAIGLQFGSVVNLWDSVYPPFDWVLVRPVQYT